MVLPVSRDRVGSRLGGGRSQREEPGEGELEVGGWRRLANRA